MGGLGMRWVWRFFFRGSGRRHDVSADLVGSLFFDQRRERDLRDNVCREHLLDEGRRLFDDHALFPEEGIHMHEMYRALQKGSLHLSNMMESADLHNLCVAVLEAANSTNDKKNNDSDNNNSSRRRRHQAIDRETFATLYVDMILQLELLPKRDKPPRPHLVIANTTTAADDDATTTTTATHQAKSFQYKMDSLARYIDECDSLGWKITRYRERHLVELGWLRMVTGTVLMRPGLWQQMLFALGTAALTTAITVLTLLACNVGTDRAGSCRGGDGLSTLQLSSLKKLDVGRMMASETILGLIMGLFVEKAVKIWWCLRLDQLQGLFNIICSMVLRAAIYFPHANNSSDAHARLTILRYGCASIALLFKDARELDCWTTGEYATYQIDNIDFAAEGLLTSEEVERLRAMPTGAGSRSQVIFVWLASFFTKLCLDGKLPMPLENQNEMLRSCEEARNKIGEIMATVSMQYPLEYTHLVVLMYKTAILLLAVETGLILGFSGCAPDGDGNDFWLYLCTRSLLLVAIPVVYQGLGMIRNMIQNPFVPTSATSYSWKVFHARVANEARSLLLAGRRPPYVPRERKFPANLPPQYIERQISSAMYE